jgi:hypothetical protein
MCYLKITAANGTSTLLSENNSIILSLTAQTTTNGIVKAGRITAVKYNAVTVDPVAQYDTTNTLYEYGHLTDHGSIQAIFTNK